MVKYNINFTPAHLVLEWVQGDTQRVTLTGDREKVLYEGDNFGKANSVYQKVMAHYEKRKREET